MLLNFPKEINQRQTKTPHITEISLDRLTLYESPSNTQEMVLRKSRNLYIKLFSFTAQVVKFCQINGNQADCDGPLML